MKNNPKRRIAVIGRGIAGLCAALRLQQNQWDVSLFAPKASRGERASEAAVGISSVRGLVLGKSDIFSAKLKGHDCFPRFLREIEQMSGQKIPFCESGVFETFANLREYQSLRKRIYHGEFSGCFAMEVLSLEKLHQKTTLTKNGFNQKSRMLGAFYYPKDYFFSPKSFLLALESAFLSLGGSFFEHSIEGVKPHPDEGLELKTNLEKSECFAEVVLACGAHTPELLSRFTKKKFSFVTIPGQTLVAKTEFSCEEAYKAARFGMVVQGGELRFGSLDHAKNQPLSAEDLAQGQKLLQARLLQDFNQSVVDSKSEYGVRLAVKDRLPLFGSLPVFEGTRRVWLLTGFHKNGYDMAEGLANKLVEELQGDSRTSRSPFDLRRFD